ncbi:alpha/beta hydrolase [Pseudobutyrivibrio sp.]
MKKLVNKVICVLAIASMMTGCGQAESKEEPQAAPAATSTDYQWDFAKKNGDIDALKEECDEKGEVITIEYETPAYAINDLKGVDETLTKTMTVYLPYGYDENGQYNVLYLLHGTRGETDPAMETIWLEGWSATRNILDNMIKEGMCEPTIVVCPTYYSEMEGYEMTEDDAKALSEKLNDEMIYADKAEDGGEVDNAQNIWPVYFGQELRNNIIPTAESQLATYAGHDVSEENLIATRDHRAFAGLSRGSMTVARSGMTDNTDLFAYFGMYSGAWQKPEAFEKAMIEDFADYEIKFWYNGNGAGDFALENHKDFCEKVLSDIPDKFTDGQNYAFVKLRDGAHMFASWQADLYNSLLVFFK